MACKPILNRDRSIETFQVYEVDLGKENTNMETIKFFKSSIAHYLCEHEKKFDQKFSFDPLPTKSLDVIKYALRVQLKKSRDKKTLWYTQSEFSIFVRDLVNQIKTK